MMKVAAIVFVINMSTCICSLSSSYAETIAASTVQELMSQVSSKPCLHNMMPYEGAISTVLGDNLELICKEVEPRIDNINSNRKQLLDSLFGNMKQAINDQTNRPSVTHVTKTYRPPVFNIGTHVKKPNVHSVEHGTKIYRPPVYVKSNRPSVFSVTDIKATNRPSVFSVTDIKAINRPSVFSVNDIKATNRISVTQDKVAGGESEIKYLGGDRTILFSGGKPGIGFEHYLGKKFTQLPLQNEDGDDRDLYREY